MLNHTRIGTRCGTIIILFFLFFFFDSPIFPLRSNFTIHRCSSTNDTKSYTRLKWFFFFCHKEWKNTKPKKHLQKEMKKRKKKTTHRKHFACCTYGCCCYMLFLSLSLSERWNIIWFGCAQHSRISNQQYNKSKSLYNRWYHGIYGLRIEIQYEMNNNNRNK